MCCTAVSSWQARVRPPPRTPVSTASPLRFPQAREEVYWLGLLCRLLETRLLQVMRFRYGEIYSASVAYFFGCEAVSNTGGWQWAAGRVGAEVKSGTPGWQHRLGVRVCCC